MSIASAGGVASPIAVRNPITHQSRKKASGMITNAASSSGAGSMCGVVCVSLRLR